VILEIGCGENPWFKGREDLINLDIRPIKDVVHIIADARKLPIRNNAFDHVFSSHLIEHFGHYEIDSILKEWIRVLKPKGVFEIRCPNLKSPYCILRILLDTPDIAILYGAQDYPENFHKTGFTPKVLKKKLEKLGISNIRIIRDNVHSKSWKKLCLGYAIAKLSSFISLFSPSFSTDIHLIGVKSIAN